MVGVIVTFRYGSEFNEATLRKIAETARTKFAGMPGLRQKVFTFDPARREATNFYLWDSGEAAREFFSEELLEKVAAQYGTHPGIQFLQVAELVDNAHA